MKQEETIRKLVSRVRDLEMKERESEINRLIDEAKSRSFWYGLMIGLAICFLLMIVIF